MSNELTQVLNNKKGNIKSGIGKDISTCQSSLYMKINVS